MSKLSFSGHESFICKQFWLKKGFDFVKSKKKFSDEIAVVELGVGKNMVNSLRHWLKSFGLTDENDEPTQLAEFLFGKKGRDPYLEDFGTIWLLHYHLVKTNRASLYNLVFNEFRKKNHEFTKEQLHHFLKKQCEEISQNLYNPNTINSDISVFLRSYVKPVTKGNNIEIEDEFVGFLMDLKLLASYEIETAGKKRERYKIESDEKIDLPYPIVLYSILDNPTYSNSISFKELRFGYNSAGMIFALSEEGLFNKIEQITANYSTITFTETSGNQVLQFKAKPDKWEVLNDYYGV